MSEDIEEKDKNAIEKQLEDAFSFKAIGQSMLGSVIKPEQANELFAQLNNAMQLLEQFVLKPDITYTLKKFKEGWYLFEIKKEDIEQNLILSKDVKHTKLDNLLNQLKDILNAG